MHLLLTYEVQNTTANEHPIIDSSYDSKIMSTNRRMADEFRTHSCFTLNAPKMVRTAPR